MKKVFVWGILFVFLTSAVNVWSQCIIDKSNWTLVFNDDFNGTTQDLQNNWYFEYTYGPVHSPGSSWFETYNTPSNVSVSNGYAYINTYKTSPISYGGYNYDYSSAILRSRFADYQTCDYSNDNDKSGYLYGMFEIRCKLPGKNGQAPAFWLTGNNSWPPEIDGFEFNGSDHHTIFSSVHYRNGNNPEGASNYYNYPSDLTSDFHTYTVVWTPTKITWFIDGRELKSDNITMHLPGTDQSSNFSKCMWAKMDIILQNALNWPDSWETSFDPFIIDYVRVYKPNSLPAYTTQDFDGYFNNTLFPAYANTSYKSSQDWILNKIVVPSGSYNAYSSLNVLQNGGKYYYKGDYNLLWTTYWYDYGSGGQYYSTPLDWYHTISGTISVSSPDIYTEIPFFRSGSAIEYYQDGQFHEINSDIGANTITPALFADPDGLQVLSLCNDNNLYLYYRTSASSHTWARNQVTFSGTVTSQIAVAQGGFSTAYYRDAYNRLVSLYFSDSYSSASIISTVSDVYSSLTVSPSGNMVYYKTQYNELYYYTNGPGGWTRAAFSAVYPWSSGQSWQVFNVSADLQVGENPSQVYYLGTDNRVWVLYHDGTNWQATPIHWLIDYAIRDLKITEPATSSRRLSFVGPDNQIRSFYYDYCEVLNPAAGSTTPLGTKNMASFKPVAEPRPVKTTELKIWPNPVGSTLSFGSAQFAGENAIITIFDSKGQRILQNSKLINAETETIMLPQMAPAMYYLQVISKGHSAAAKFIKKE